LGSINLFLHIVKSHADFLQVCSVEQLPLGILVKLVKPTVRVIYDCREDMYHSMLHSKTRFRGVTRIALAACTFCVEHLAMRLFDALVTADPGVASLHGGMPERRKSVFYNTANQELFGAPPVPLRERPYDLALLGGMGRRSGLYVLLDAVEALWRDGVRCRILLIGNPEGEGAVRIQGIAAKYHMSNGILITGQVKHSDVPKLLQKAKIGLVTLLDMPKYHYNIACKVFEYMACGMPTICSDLPPQHHILDQGGAALFFRPGDSGDLAQKIRMVIHDEPRLVEMGRAARKLFETIWNSDLEQRKYQAFIACIGNMRPRGSIWRAT
jgi:glycosyltransferase involved in cell wall biosynthesis